MLILFFHYVELSFSYVIAQDCLCIYYVVSATLHSPEYLNIVYIKTMPESYLKITVFI